MAKNKVLFISQDIAPYLPDTPLSIQGRNIPQGIITSGYEVRTFMPKYGCINERRNQLHEVIRLSGLNIVIDDTDHPLIIKVATLQPTRMQVYFIDNDDYFDEQGVTTVETKLFPEINDERLIFYAHGVIETVKKLRWDPQVIQCMGWISALAPLFLRYKYAEDPTFANAKIVYTICDDAFDGTLAPRFIEKLKMAGFTDKELAPLADDSLVDFKALTRLAIKCSDAVVVATPNAGPELIDYARQSGKPVLDYPGEDKITEDIVEFYHSLGVD